MKVLGIAAAVLTVLSFVLWAITWVFYFVIVSASNYSSTMQTVMQGATAVSQVLLYLAVLLICAGLLTSGKSAKSTDA